VEQEVTVALEPVLSLKQDFREQVVGLAEAEGEAVSVQMF
jgi:hypothetical protein